MDKLDKYRTCIIELIKNRAKESNYLGDVIVNTIIDKEGDHYILCVDGWHNHKRIYGHVYHLDIRNSKVWIQFNSTEIDIAEELVTMGIDKKDIVIGFHEPTKRKYSEYSVE